MVGRGASAHHVLHALHPLFQRLGLVLLPMPPAKEDRTSLTDMDFVNLFETITRGQILA